VPGLSVDEYLVFVTILVQISPVMVSPTLTMAFAAPVEVFVVPVTFVRYAVPAGQPVFVDWFVYFNDTVVVPLPFFHLIVDVVVPVSLLIGTVVDDVAPAFSAVGVHALQFDTVVPVFFTVLSVVVAASFEQKTCGGDADADWASGSANPVAAIAVAAQNAPSFESLTDVLPLVETSFSSARTLVSGRPLV